MSQFVGRNGRAPAARSLTVRIGLALTLLLAGAALGGGTANAATPNTPFGAVTVKPIGINGSWGERMAAAKHDYNGDGAGDVFVADQQDGRVYLLSGKAIARPSQRTTPLRIFHNPLAEKGLSNTGRFGNYISVVGDVTGDGAPDLAVGTPLAEVAGVWPAGTVYLFNGATGKLIRQLDSPNPERNSRYGERIGSAGDVTGDTRPEVIVGAAGVTVNGKYGVGKAYIFNGATGAVHRTLDMPAGDLPTCGQYCQFGLSVQGPGDVDGDRTPDQLVNAGYWGDYKGRSYVFSGKTGALISTIANPEPESTPSFFGFQDAAPLAPGDVDKDGFADVYQGSFEQDGPAGTAQGKAWVFSGKELAAGDPTTPDTTPLYALDDPTPEHGGQFGWAMDKTDYNKDGTPDLYLGESPHHAGIKAGGTNVMNGANGNVLKQLNLPASCEQPAALGWSIAAPGDLNADGEPDFVAGAPYFDIPQGQPDQFKVNQGMVFTFVSNPGTLPTPCTKADGLG